MLGIPHHRAAEPRMDVAIEGRPLPCVLRQTFELEEQMDPCALLLDLADVRDELARQMFLAEQAQKGRRLVQVRDHDGRAEKLPTP